MIPFIIKKKLENIRSFKEEITKTVNDLPVKELVDYELYAICKGFDRYLLDGLKIGQEIKLFTNYEGKTQADIDAENAMYFNNNLSLLIDLAWVKNGIIEKIQQTSYQLMNDKWMNANGEYVDKIIPDPNSTIENPLPDIENPLATQTECDFWLDLIVNIDVNDRYLIEQGFLRLDLVQHQWANVLKW